jgi:DNA (cytosine-5)-methyltransferase 1
MLLLSLFCGAGGLDLGFEQAGFEIGLALDRKSDSVKSYNHNRPASAVAHVQDLSAATIADIDAKFGGEFRPAAVIGGPPCQSFSQANVNQREDDVRKALPVKYAELVVALHERSPLDFIVMENVIGLAKQKHVATLIEVERALEKAGLVTRRFVLNAKDHGTPQNRPRLFLVGINESLATKQALSQVTVPIAPGGTVGDTIRRLPEPIRFRRGLDMATAKVHPNHWCMSPRSPKFRQDGGVKPGVRGRSFKMLDWNLPSIAVAYGHREVNIHPSGHRRLSVYEAMLLQGFPAKYTLIGNLSSQIDQVSEAVPPPLARAVASTIKELLKDQELDDAA